MKKIFEMGRRKRRAMILAASQLMLLITGCGNNGTKSSDRGIAKAANQDTANGTSDTKMNVEDVVKAFELGDALPEQSVDPKELALWRASLVPESQIKPADVKMNAASFQLNDVAPGEREIVDLRGNDTGIRNQGSEGTCTAFATVAALENVIKRNYGEAVDLSERHHWTTYADYQTTSSLKKASAAPIVSEVTWPYNGRKPASITGLGVAKINSYSTTQLALAPVVESLRKGNPVVIAIGVLSSLMNPRQGGIVQGGSVDGGAGHALAVTGAIIDARVAGGGYFIVKNSWGPNWGDKGYGYVAFDYCQRTWCSAYSVSDASLYKDGVVVPKPDASPVPTSSVSPTPVVPVPTATPGPVDPSPTSSPMPTSSPEPTLSPAPTLAPTPDPVDPTVDLTAADFQIVPYATRRSYHARNSYILTIEAEQAVLQQIKSIKYSDSGSRYTVTNGAGPDVQLDPINLASPAFVARGRVVQTDDIVITLRNGKMITLSAIRFRL